MTARPVDVDLAAMTDEELALLHTAVREEDRARLGRRLRELVIEVAPRAVGVLVQRWEARGEYGWEVTRVYFASVEGQDCDDVSAETALGAQYGAEAVGLVGRLWDLEGSCARPGAAAWVNDRIPVETVLTVPSHGRVIL